MKWGEFRGRTIAEIELWLGRHDISTISGGILDKSSILKAVGQSSDPYYVRELRRIFYRGIDRAIGNALLPYVPKGGSSHELLRYFINASDPAQLRDAVISESSIKRVSLGHTSKIYHKVMELEKYKKLVESGKRFDFMTAGGPVVIPGEPGKYESEPFMQYTRRKVKKYFSTFM